MFGSSYLPVTSVMIESPTIRVPGSSAFCEMGPCWLEVAVDACAARLLATGSCSVSVRNVRLDASRDSGARVADACAGRLSGDRFMVRLCPHHPSGTSQGSGLHGWQARSWTLEVAGTGSSATGLTGLTAG